MAYGWSRWLHGGGAQPMPLPSSPVQPAIPSASVSPPGGYPSLCNPVSALGDAGPASSSSGSDKDVQSTSSIDEVGLPPPCHQRPREREPRQPRRSNSGGRAADFGGLWNNEMDLCHLSRELLR